MKQDTLVLPGKDKLNVIKFLISKALIESCISHDKVLSLKNALGEYNEMKKGIKNPEKAVEYTTRLI